MDPELDPRLVAEVRAMEWKYLTCAETARLVRAQLKRTFPGIKFYVRSHNYAGGASINVDFIPKDGGPDWRKVQAAVQQYAAREFDSMIDYGWRVRSWLNPDGTSIVAYNEGSEPGQIKGEVNAKPDPKAVLVIMGADYVFVQQKIETEGTA